MREGYRAYMASQLSWYAGHGLQMIMFPWLLVVVLHEPADRVGLAQMMFLAPSAILMLLGGAIADRGDGRRLLIWLQLVATIPPLLLALVIAGEGLSYSLVVAYGVAFGLISAFVVPTRDGLLNQVASNGLQRAVAAAIGCQFGGQILSTLR